MPVRAYPTLLLTLTLALLSLVASPARAQWIYNPTDVTLSGGTNCAAGTSASLDYVVTTPGTVADVDFGLRALHDWRGDIRATLISPAGTTVQLITEDTGGTGNLDNYRIRLDDAAADTVNQGTHNTNQTTTGDRYEVSVRPDNALAAFNGEPANGTWTLELCDAFPGADDGTVTDTTLFITPTQEPQPPTLACTVGAAVPHVWTLTGANSWAAGSLVNGYTADDIALNFAVTGATNRLIPRNGTATPVTSTEFAPTGGAPALASYADFATTAESMTLTLNLGVPGQGVEAVQFALQDVDRNGWQDSVSVAGSLAGAAVTPALTPGLANSVLGNAIVGSATVESGDTAGEGTITFAQPIDQLVLTYGSGPGANADPPPQIMAFFADMTLCPIPLPALTATKTVEAADMDSLMTPGSEVIYKIVVAHNAQSNSAATNVDIQDVLPPTLEFVSATSTGFSAGSFGNPSLPAANTDCGVGSCVVSFENGTLPTNATGEILITALIK